MKLTAMQFKLKFDRPIDREKHYICPGGYVINEKSFDFQDFEGTIDPQNSDTLICNVYNYDNDYADENDGAYVTSGDIKKSFSEFFVYTGENDDPEINPIEVTDLVFWFNEKNLVASKKTVESATRALAS